MCKYTFKINLYSVSREKEIDFLSDTLTIICDCYSGTRSGGNLAFVLVANRHESRMLETSSFSRETEYL